MTPDPFGRPDVYHVLVNGHCVEHTESFAEVVSLVIARGGGATLAATAPNRWDAIASNDDKLHVKKLGAGEEDRWLE